MAKIMSHARSISLPTSSHPLFASAEEHLQRLESSKGASSSSPHASACKKLDGLKNLYEYLDDVLQLPLSQKVLSHEICGKWDEEVLDGSLRLLDICGAVREIYSQMREIVQTLESSLRRKRGGDYLVNEIGSYLVSKKQLNKMICKCYKELKRAEKKCEKRKDSDRDPLVKLIKEVQETSFSILDSTLSFISQSKAAGSQQRSWSLVSKFIQQKGSSYEGDSDIEKIDVELHLLNNKKSNKASYLLETQNPLKRLEAFETSIQELAEVLEIMFRLLLKTRVSLLNILNH
ncbi:hypothetical protein ACH5RR_035309 [Cinchona calisaya]|uniref:DUF241 domain protein n=1 Tax=Cinchona calisaya TaxID=153742 RepID=A0ABD2YDG9_9GENT